MGKKIALFILGVVLFIGAFLAYQYFTGASFSAAKKPALVASTQPEELPPTFESRRPNGDLEWLLSTKKAVPFKDSNGNVVPGEYALTEPSASYYTDDGKIAYIRADRGNILMDESGVAAANRGGKPEPKGGHLSGNVVLTYGPRETFTDNSLDRKPGQLQVRFEKDLDLNYAEQLLTSPGLVHLRSDQLEFDGENLTIAFNRGMKRIELLRIDPPVGSGKNNYMLIKDVGKDAAGFGDVSKPETPAGAQAPAANTAAVAKPAPAARTAVSQNTTAPVVAPTTTTKKEIRTNYKLSFGKEVTATVGPRVLTSDQLFVLFSPPTPGENKAEPASSATPAAGKGTRAPVPSNGGPASATPAKAAVVPPTPITPTKGDDLEVRWTGPMEMRPAADTDLQLVDRHDFAMEAVGTTERPVIVKDPTYAATAGRLWFHRAEQRFELEPAGLPTVTATDKDPQHPTFGTGRLVCQGLSFFRAANHVSLQGPGTIEVPPELMGRESQGKSEKPLLATWQKQLDVEFASVGNSKDPEKSKRVPRHVVFTGDSDITSSDFHIDSNMLDVLVANAGADAKGNQKSVLEHVLATGGGSGVHLKYPHQSGGTIDEAAKPDGLNADRLELMTEIPGGAGVGGGGGPVPSRLLAEGNVEAWSYAPHRENGTGAARETGQLDKQAIYTPKLDVALEPRKSSGTGTGGTGGGMAKNVQAKSLIASEGVIVELEGFSAETVQASGRTLTVITHADQGRELATAVIDGEGMPDGTIKYAQLTQGPNKIGGEHIDLDQHTRMISIPGKGQFDFVQPPPQAEKDKPATPVTVTWDRKMDFDGRSMMARFFGNVDGHVHDRKDLESQLTCDDELDVQLAKRGKDAGNLTANGAQGGRGLQSLRAVGNVKAYGATLDESGKPITGLLIEKTNLLKYDDATKRLDIPGAGMLSVLDNRPEKPGETDQGGRGSTVFKWQGSLTYVGVDDLITLDDRVYMRHQPLKPMKGLGGATGAPGVTAAAAPNGKAKNPPIELWTDKLTAKLKGKDATRGATANPLEMGSGEQKLELVTAQGTPQQDSKLQMGTDESIIARTLIFDTVRNQATGIAAPEGIGQLTRPGEALVNFQKVVWDMTKNQNAFTITGGSGEIQQ